MAEEAYDPGLNSKLISQPPPTTPATATPTSAPDTPYDPGGSLLNTPFRQLPSASSDGSLWGAAARGLGLGTRDVIEGVSALPTAALDVATWPARVAQR